MVQGYCLREKKKVEIKDAVFELNKAGRPVAHGKCSSCGSVVYKILKAEEVPAALKEKAAKFKRGGGSRRSRKSHSSRKSPARKSRKSKSSRKSRKSRK